MQTYNLRFSGTLEATLLVGLFTLINGSVQAGLLTEYEMQATGTASAANEAGLYRIGTAGTTGGGAVTAVPTNPGYAAWSGTAFASYATQPIKGALMKTIPINSNGQRVFWRCNPNLNNAFSIPAGNVAAASVGIFTVSGTSGVVGNVQIAAI